MPGKRRPMAVNMAVVQNGGGKHWTKSEIEDRESSEVKLPKPKALTPPAWLSDSGKKLFRKYAKQLLAFPAGMVSTLDAGTLARYCDCELSYAEASKNKSVWMETATRRLADLSASAALVRNPSDIQRLEMAYEGAKSQLDFWTGQMVKFEKIARGCATEMGLTITSRCRLVVPESGAESEEDPLAALQKRLLSG